MNFILFFFLFTEFTFVLSVIVFTTYISHNVDYLIYMCVRECEKYAINHYRARDPLINLHVESLTCYK